MNFLIASLRPTLSAVLLCIIGHAWVTPSAQAQTVPNGDFSFAQGSIGGIIGTPFNAQLGAGPWYANSSGILGLLEMPVINISSGVGSISGLANLGGGFTTARIYNSNIGTNFISGQTYTLTASFSSATALNLSLLSNAGFGAALYYGGSGTNLGTLAARTSPTLSVLNVDLLNPNNGTLTVSYLAGAPASGQSIGISLFAGEGTGLNLGALGGISFDNVAVSAVPEPATFGIIGGTLALAGAVFMRRRQVRS